MGLPTNSSRAKSAGCSPTSSNCVVWQGDDIRCINLCKGDTITEVVEKLADELCNIMDTLDITEYELSCFSLSTPKISDFHDLMQTIINKICALEGIDNSGGGVTPTTCPDNCIVTIAECFRFQNQTGDTITTMSLVDYVRAIGTRLCEIIGDIEDINEALVTLGNRVTETENDIEDINASKVQRSEVEYTPTEELDPVPAVLPLKEAVKLIEDLSVRQLNATGTASKIYQSLFMGVSLEDENALSVKGTYKSLPGWVTSMTSLSDSYNNMWVIIKDVKKAVEDIQINNSSNACGLIRYNFRTSLNSSDPANIKVVMYFDGTTGLDNYREVDANGSTFVITDNKGNKSTSKIKILDTIKNPSGYSYNLTGTSIDSTTDLTISVIPSMYNNITNTNCTTNLTSIIRVQDPCIGSTFTPGTTNIDYTIDIIAGYSYVIDLYLEGGLTPINSVTYNVPPVDIAGSFTGLTTTTNYEVQVTAVDSMGINTSCPRINKTTL